MAKVTDSVRTDNDYQAESDFSTLERAEEVKGNSKRFNLARKAGLKKMNATARVLKKTRIGKSKKGKSGLILD